MKSKILVIVGPTASGKTAFAKEIARRYNGELLSVDSRQIYRGMDIGTNKESVERGIDLVDPDVEFSVSDFKTYAEAAIKDMLGRGKLPILVVGTGLWLWAILEDLPLAQVPKDERLREVLESMALEDLVKEYEALDPVGVRHIDKKNKRRLVRAIEVSKTSGVPFSQLRKKGEPRYDVLSIGLSVPREVLWERIEKRVDTMIHRGLEQEVKALVDKYGWDVPAMSGIGYREWRPFLEGRADTPPSQGGDGGGSRAVAATIVKDTKMYAKRQMTWFRRDETVAWVDPQGPDTWSRLIGLWRG